LRPDVSRATSTRFHGVADHLKPLSPSRVRGQYSHLSDAESGRQELRQNPPLRPGSIDQPNPMRRSNRSDGTRYPEQQPLFDTPTPRAGRCDEHDPDPPGHHDASSDAPFSSSIPLANGPGSIPTDPAASPLLHQDPRVRIAAIPRRHASPHFQTPWGTHRRSTTSTALNQILLRSSTPTPADSTERGREVPVRSTFDPDGEAGAMLLSSGG
jgi:hypothetical protein